MAPQLLRCLVGDIDVRLRNPFLAHELDVARWHEPALLSLFVGEIHVFGPGRDSLTVCRWERPLNAVILGGLGLAGLSGRRAACTRTRRRRPGRRAPVIVR